MEKNRRVFYIPILLAVFMTAGLFIGSALTPQVEGVQTGKRSQYQKLQDIIHILDKKYVDSVDREDLFERTISDMLHRLDPHSNYIAAKDLQIMNEEIEGKFGGVGIRFFIIRDTVCVTNVLPNSPSERAGLKAGDRIIGIDGDEAASVNITNEEVMDRLKGPEGTSVQLQLFRDGKKLAKTVKRGSIPVKSVTAAYMLNSTTGFVRVERFSVETAKEFRAAVYGLKQDGMSKLILDVRDNGGGVLTGATQIVDEFLHSDKPILETRGVNSGKTVYRSTSSGALKNVEVAVLINSNSASASEILAGALQDNDRATIIGRRSFGKGLVQEDVPLRDGSNLRLTVARYYTPTGRCIQKPYNGDIDDYYHDQADRIDNGELYEIDSTWFVDSLKFTTPKGKTVYGGGGIMPDIFVPVDSSGNTWYYTSLRISSAFPIFAFDYVRSKRSKWQSPEAFRSSFTVSDALVDRFVRFAEQELKVRTNKGELKHSKALIKRTLKSEIARQLWVEQGFFVVHNTTDPEVQKALNHLK